MSSVNKHTVADALAAALSHKSFAHRFAAFAGASGAWGRVEVVRRPLLIAAMTREGESADLAVIFRRRDRVLLELLVAVEVDTGVIVSADAQCRETTRYRLEAELKMSMEDAERVLTVLVCPQAWAGTRYASKFDAVVAYEKLLPWLGGTEAEVMKAAARMGSRRVSGAVEARALV